MVGMELVIDRQTKEPATVFTKELISLCRERGLLMVSAGTHANIIRPMMPLVIENEDLLLGLNILKESLEKICRRG